MQLLKGIGHRGRRIIPHACGADFMNDLPGSCQPIIILFSRLIAQNLSAHRIQYFFKRIMHMLRLITFVIRPGIVKAQHRYTKFIYYLRIDFTIIVFTRNAFTSAGDTYYRPIKLFNISSQPVTISTHFFSDVFIEIVWIETKSIRRHPHSSPHLHVIASWKIKFFIIQPPWCVDMHTSHTILIIHITIHQRRNKCCATRSGGIMQIFSNHATGVA